MKIEFKTLLMTIIIISIVIASLIYLIILKWDKNQTKKIVEKDSVLVLEYKKPIEIKRMKGIISYKNPIKSDSTTDKNRDTTFTIRKIENYISEIDTVINSDTMIIKYYYPENEFDISYHPAIDTNYIHYYEISDEKNNLGMIILFYIGTFIAGVIIGILL